MSGFVPKPNTGTLWPNDRKSAPTHPDLRGDIHIDRDFLLGLIDKADGQLIKIAVAAWDKQINGKNCLSLSASEPYVKPAEGGYGASSGGYSGGRYAQPATRAPAPPPAQQRMDDDDDIPF